MSPNRRASSLGAVAHVVWGRQGITRHDVRALCAGEVELIGSPPSGSGAIYVVLELPDHEPLRLAGRVRASSRTGDTFRVRLVHERAATEDLIQQSLLTHLERLVPTVLVVDDEAIVRKALCRELDALDHTSVSAATPLEALRWLKRRDTRIEAVLVDLHLGPADGMDVLALIESEHPKVRRVVMSAQARPCQLELALVSGRAHATLPKPWARDALIAAVAA